MVQWFVVEHGLEVVIVNLVKLRIDVISLLEVPDVGHEGRLIRRVSNKLGEVGTLFPHLDFLAILETRVKNETGYPHTLARWMSWWLELVLVKTSRSVKPVTRLGMRLNSHTAC